MSLATRSIGDPEGGPPGYTILYVRGDDLALAFRPVNESGPVVMITHPRDRLLATSSRHIVRGSDRILVRAWPDAEISGVRCRIDDGDWSELQPLDDGHWTGPLPGEQLDKGEHSLEVIGAAPGQSRGQQHISFMVDPTGRYTAFPETRPVVRQTRFC